MKYSLLHVELLSESDIVVARQRARQVGALLHFDAQDQIRVATAVSELARNAVRHAGGGGIEFSLEIDPAGDATLWIDIDDCGPGIADLDSAISSPIGGEMGGGEAKLGLVTARRMVDSFHLASAPGRGTTITLSKRVSRRSEAFTPAHIAAITGELSARRIEDPNAEIQQQNRELLRSLEELRLRQEELTRLNSELEDTNRGVLALYAELDERATHLRVADETKTRFLSSISHEFRTPVNSILALSKILLHRLDGELNGEQEKQVRYICQAAEQMSTLIDDLLDLRKVEAGKFQMHIEAFNVPDLFGALRGMFKPLAVNDQVALIFEEPGQLPELHTDQGKVSQILRNLISNALKFTGRGWVRVSAKVAGDGCTIVFSVADTGLGIAPEHHRRVFEEFTQVENPLQTFVKGTGLGLPVSQRLAGLLGGSIELQSRLGQGSVFSLAIPLRLDVGAGTAGPMATSAPVRRAARRILIVDDDEIERYALRQFLAAGHYDVIEASGGYEGLRQARLSHPDLIFLDLAMPDIHGREILRMLKSAEETRGIPVVIFTSQRRDEIDSETTAAANQFLMKSELSREAVANILRCISAAQENSHASTV